MVRDKFEIASILVNKMDKIEKTILELQSLTSRRSFIISSNEVQENVDTIEVVLNEGDISTEIFIQDILELYINTLNLELNELRKSFEEL
jgi:hypothetical protein